MGTARQTAHSAEIQINEELLLACVRASPDHAAILGLLERPGFAWESFWTLASSQQVQPLVARILSDTTLKASLPPDARQAVKAARVQTTLSNMANQAELQTIAARLTEHGIPVVPLKGTQLAQRLFDSLDARRCGDIDILVPEDDWDAAYRVLIEAGYQPAAAVRPGIERHTFHGVPLVRIANGRAFQVEVHRQLTDPRFMTIDYRPLWERVALTTVQPGRLADLPAEELLVFLAIHAPKHCNGGLRLLADIDRLLRREGVALDWSYVVTLAKAWHADAILYFVLTLSAALLLTPIPDDALSAIRPPAWKRVMVPFLVGPQTILRPPAALHLRSKRFQIAYCLMLQRGGRVLRSYWHYIVMPPRLAPENALLGVTQAVRRPLDGLAWTALALGSALRDRYRIRAAAQS